eukprot:6210050-Pleurochrysis_carterae.AAC.2
MHVSASASKSEVGVHGTLAAAIDKLDGHNCADAMQSERSRYETLCNPQRPHATRRRPRLVATTQGAT